MKRALKETQRACADLYIFDAVVGLLEGSTAPSNTHHKAAQQIIGICKTEIQRALTRMDKADAQLLAAAQKGQPP
jgi:hypothetical protein